MSTRTERDKQKSLQEKHQAILSMLLKDEDNKYCVDCDAKGPRWASWNLGIFLCIRCAGIHRNLGVHISKVKSVNLDSWTPEQIAMVQEMGNSRARAVYEANVPDNFRRPQTDSSLEAFIRSKYETKKYIAQEWVPPKYKVPQAAEVEERKEKKRSRSKPSPSVNLTNNPLESSNSSRREQKSAEHSKPEPKKPPPPSAKIDLLGLDDPVPEPAAPVAAQGGSSDLFGDFIGSTPTHVPPQDPHSLPRTSGDGEESLFGESAEVQNKAKATKDSILALYGNQATQQQQQQQVAYGMPGGMYMAGQQMPTQQMPTQQMPAQQMPAQQQMATQQMANGYMAGMMPQAGMPMQQPNMMMGQQMPGAQQQGMLGMQQYNMYNMQQQQQYQQMQNQFNGMNVGQPGMTGFQPAAPAGNWGASQSAGQTLSNNLWQ